MQGKKRGFGRMVPNPPKKKNEPHLSNLIEALTSASQAVNQRIHNERGVLICQKKIFILKDSIFFSIKDFRRSWGELLELVLVATLSSS